MHPDGRYFTRPKYGHPNARRLIEIKDSVVSVLKPLYGNRNYKFRQEDFFSVNEMLFAEGESNDIN